MVVEFKDAYQKRLFKANEKLLKMYDELKLDSETFYDDAATITNLQKEVSADYKNYAEMEEAKEKREADQKAGFWTRVISAGGILVTLVTFIVGEVGRTQRFHEATKYEEENPVIGMANKSAVSDGLRSTETKPPIGFRLFK